MSRKNYDRRGEISPDEKPKRQVLNEGLSRAAETAASSAGAEVRKAVEARLKAFKLAQGI